MLHQETVTDRPFILSVTQESHLQPPAPDLRPGLHATLRHSCKLALIQEVTYSLNSLRMRESDNHLARGNHAQSPYTGRSHAYVALHRQRRTFNIDWETVLHSQPPNDFLKIWVTVIGLQESTGILNLIVICLRNSTTYVL